MNAYIIPGIEDPHIEVNDLTPEQLQERIIDKLFEIIYWRFGAIKAQIRSKSRKQKLVFIRQASMFVLKTNYGFSYSKASGVFLRDHTTCIHAKKKVCSALQGYDPDLLSYTQTIQQLLKAKLSIN